MPNTGRTVPKYLYAYYDGYDVSGYKRSIGPLEATFTEVDLTAQIDPVNGFLPGHNQANIGTLVANFDNTPTSGILAVGDAGKGLSHTVLVAQGIRAAPAAGDPAFMGFFSQKEFSNAIDQAGGAQITMAFSGWGADGLLQYANPWGSLIHPLAAETAVNSAGAGVDGGAATALGGFACFQLNAYTGGTGPVLKVQHSVDAVNGDYSDLLSSGVLAVAPTASLVALALGTTVKEFLRWQIVLNGATTATFAIGFVRSLGV